MRALPPLAYSGTNAEMGEKMTADDIIRANPEYRYQPGKIGGLDGLKGTNPETGSEQWLVYNAVSHVTAPGPWTHEQIKAAAANLAGAAGHVDRRTYLERPPRLPNE